MSSSYTIPNGCIKVKINNLRTHFINHCFINGDICYVYKVGYDNAIQNIKQVDGSIYNTTVPLTRLRDGIGQYVCIAEFNVIPDIKRIEII